MSLNAELIQKAIDSTDFLNGGSLNAMQQEKYVMLVRKYATFLNKARFIRMTQPNQEIDKLHLGEPITEGAAEDADSGNTSSLKFSKVSLAAKKVRSAWNITTESIQSALTQNDFEDNVMEAMTERGAHDMEELAFNGDTSLAGTTPRDRLLKVLNGWRIQSEDMHVLDAGGATISKELLTEAKRMMPKQFRKDPGLRWVASDSLVDDWKNYLANRGTSAGDRAIEGVGLRPLSIPFEEVPIIPDDLAVTVSFATPGKVTGTQYGPFVIASGNSNFKVNVDSAGAVTVALTTGTRLGSEVAQDINAAYVAAHGATYSKVARVAPDGRLVLVSPTAGTSATIVINGGGAPASDAAATLGFTAGTSAGLAAAATNTLTEGTCLWLINPKNFIFSLLDGTRTFGEFRPRYDRIEMTMFNQLDCKVENFDAGVFIKNVRLSPLSTGLV